MGTHVGDGHGLIGGLGGGRRGRRVRITRCAASDESTADLVAGAQLSAGERPDACDGGTRAVIAWRLGLEKREDTLDAVGGPRGDETPVGLAERLRRSGAPPRATSLGAHARTYVVFVNTTRRAQRSTLIGVSVTVSPAIVHE
jgi:hypothetical protein